MNFQALKGMIDSIVEGYTCPDCKVKVGEENIEIIGTAGSNVNLEVFCPKCGKNAIIKGQVFDLNLSKLGINIDKIKNNKIKKNNKKSIKEEEIKNFNKILKTKSVSISDLFNEDVGK